MRSISVLLIIVIIFQGTFAFTSKAKQSKLLIEKVNASLNRSHLGRALKGMVQIASKLGYEYSDLYDAFSSLKNSLLIKIDDENFLFYSQSTFHEAECYYLQGNINYFQNDIEVHISFREQAIAHRENYMRLLATAQNSLAENKALKQAAEEELASSEKTYNIESAEYQQIEQIITEAISKLQEAQGHYENAQLGGFSFVQLKNIFISFAQKVKSASQKLSSKHQLFIKPVIQVMLAIKQDNGSSIQHAIDALNKLKVYIIQAFTDLTELQMVYKSTLLKAIHDHSEIIDVLENQTIPDYIKEIKNYEVSQQQIEEHIAFMIELKATIQAQLDAENVAFVAIQARHKARLDRINNEYELVTHAERLVRTAENNLEK